jgi:GntR family transcriptional repressor for pyruvate dehydrogenase complex
MAVTDEAINSLKAMILSGELRPGQRLPREPDLAAVLGLSRSSLREAVRALSLIRILDVRQGDGTYVSDLSTASLIETFNFLVDFRQDSSVIELLQVRGILEPVASGRAARLITPAALIDLKRILNLVDKNSNCEDLVQADIDFHQAIGAAAGNSVLSSLISSLSGPTQRARAWRFITQEGALERTLDEHAAIFEAIQAGDSDLASAWSTVHIKGVENWLRQAL